MTKASDNIFPKLTLVEGSAPSSPSASDFHLYFDSADHLLKWKNSAGTVTTVATGTGAAGALVFLEAHTASSSASLDFTAFISSTYDEYLIEMVNIVPATNGADFRASLSSDGGSTWNASSNYYSAIVYVKNDATTGATAYGNPTTFWKFAGSVSNSTARGVTGTLRLFSPGSTTLDKTLAGQVGFTDATNLIGATFSGLLTVGGTAFNAMRFIMSSGNIASGTIRIYGLAKS